MRVIPVLDLMGGVVVRGVGGRRNEYRPVQSRLASSARPLDVARAFRERLGLDELYVADLDALEGARGQVEIIREVAADGFRLLVDAGLRQAHSGRMLIEAGAERAVAALETSDGPDQFRSLLGELGAKHIVFSLDLKGGRLLGNPAAWDTDDPRELAGKVVGCGAQSMIVLDLAGVGERGGVPTRDLCRRLREEFPKIELVTGGGVRDARDLAELAECGMDGVLLASALHDGSLTAADLREYR
jgi:phosphoribosylformimino-5-aminoimidazole carboxamide ribotide isomerase